MSLVCRQTLIPNQMEKIKEKFIARIIAQPDQRYRLEGQWEQQVKYLEEWKKRPEKIIWNKAFQYEFPKATRAITNMVWEFHVADKPSFITSDNPIYIADGIGLGRADARLLFPISSRILLRATHMITPGLRFYPASKERIEQTNIRIAQSATRYIFYSKGTPWAENLTKATLPASVQSIEYP